MLAAKGISSAGAKTCWVTHFAGIVMIDKFGVKVVFVEWVWDVVL